MIILMEIRDDPIREPTQFQLYPVISMTSQMFVEGVIKYKSGLSNIEYLINSTLKFFTSISFFFVERTAKLIFFL